MILCVTLNPCLDKTLTVPNWEPGGNVRGTAAHEVVGGKGNNVARALRRLGLTGRPVTFLGGPVGERCRALLLADGDLDPILIDSAASTREIVTIHAPKTPATAFFDPDPAITADEAAALVARVEAELASGVVRALTMSGSSPAATTHGVFGELIGLAEAHRVPTFLDTYGPPLAALWGVWPDAMSLNRREAGGLLGGQTHPSDSQVFRLLEQWSGRGVRLAAVTDGPHAVLARVDGIAYRAIPPRVEAVNPIGSGDCHLAGLVAARLDDLGPEATLRRAVAWAVANALTWDAGAINPAEVERLEAEVQVEPYSA